MKIISKVFLKKCKLAARTRPGPLDCGVNALIAEPAIKCWSGNSGEESFLPGMTVTFFSPDRIQLREPPAQDHASPRAVPLFPDARAG